jgi:hypothetical protein
MHGITPTAAAQPARWVLLVYWCAKGLYGSPKCVIFLRPPFDWVRFVIGFCEIDMTADQVHFKGPRTEEDKSVRDQLRACKGHALAESWSSRWL